MNLNDAWREKSRQGGWGLDDAVRRGERTELYSVQSSNFTAQGLHDKCSHGIANISEG